MDELPTIGDVPIYYIQGSRSLAFRLGTFGIQAIFRYRAKYSRDWYFKKIGKIVDSKHYIKGVSWNPYDTSFAADYLTWSVLERSERTNLWNPKDSWASKLITRKGRTSNPLEIKDSWASNLIARRGRTSNPFEIKDSWTLKQIRTQGQWKVN